MNSAHLVLPLAFLTAKLPVSAAEATELAYPLPLQLIIQKDLQCARGQGALLLLLTACCLCASQPSAVVQGGQGGALRLELIKGQHLNCLHGMQPSSWVNFIWIQQGECLCFLDPCWNSARSGVSTWGASCLVSIAVCQQ
jgi:hypothetical protein